MHPSQKYLDPRELAKLQGLQLRVRAIVDGFLAGRHRSTGRGLSLEFSEHREYSPGDDWRNIDWKVYGRTDKYYLKQFEDEANLSCYFLLDCSESMSYQGRTSALSKLEYAKCLVASMAWLVLSRQDAIGMATFTDSIQDFLPASANPMAMAEMLQHLGAIAATGETNIDSAISEFAGQVNRRSVVVLVSDCFSDLDRIRHGLQRLVYQRHEVAIIQIVDPAEVDFPFTSNTVFEGMESAPDVTTDAAAIARSYRRRVAEFCSRLSTACGNHDTRFQQIRTDESLDIALSQFLSPVSTLA